MKLLIAVCLLMTLSVSSHISAKESLFAKDDALFLVSSCQEVMEIFKRRDETSFMAGQRTSLSEAMECYSNIVKYHLIAGMGAIIGTRWLK